MAHETSADLIGVHAVAAGTLPRRQHLRAHRVPRERARPVGHEGPPGRIEVDGPSHPARLVTPRLGATSHREAPGQAEALSPAADHWRPPGPGGLDPRAEVR